MDVCPVERLDSASNARAQVIFKTKSNGNGNFPFMDEREQQKKTEAK